MAGILTRLRRRAPSVTAGPGATPSEGAPNLTAQLHLRLDAVNYFLADVRGGLGPYVNVFLVTSAGWSPAEIGTVLTLSGLIGIAAHVPLGALIDAVHAKRALLVISVVLLAACAVAIERMPSGPVVFTADVTMAVLGGVFAPVVAALTLGLANDRELAPRIARNAVFDRMGNLTIAIFVGSVGWWLGQRATFYLVPLFALFSIAAVLSIPPSAIDHERARGFVHGQDDRHPQGMLALLTENRPLLILALIAATFHFANAAMLPLVGQKLALAHPGLEASLMATCIFVAQVTTIPVAIVVGARAERWGLKPLLATACLALTLRGLVFAATDNATLLIAAQVLDGVAAGIWDVSIPLLLANLVIGSGRYSTSRGLLGTIQGVGGSLSNVAAGLVTVAFGYTAAFVSLAACAGLAFIAVIVLLARPEFVKAGRIRDSADASRAGTPAGTVS